LAAGLGAALGAAPRALGATVVAVSAAGAVGAVDDLRRDAERKGLAGHLGALARGHLTTGFLKVLVLAGSGLVATALADRDGSAPGARRLLDTLLGGAVVAGC